MRITQGVVRKGVVYAVCFLLVACGGFGAVKIDVETRQGQPVAITLQSKGAASAANVSFNLTSTPANGVISGVSPNLTYTPNPGFVGKDTFNYNAQEMVSGELKVTPDAVVTITVIAVEVPDPKSNIKSLKVGEGYSVLTLHTALTGTGCDLEGSFYISESEDTDATKFKTALRGVTLFKDAEVTVAGCVSVGANTIPKIQTIALKQ